MLRFLFCTIRASSNLYISPQFTRKFSFLERMNLGKNGGWGSPPTADVALRRERCESSPIESSTYQEDEQISEDKPGDFGSSLYESSPIESLTHQPNEFSLPTCFGKRGKPSSYSRRQQLGQTSQKNLMGSRKPDFSQNLPIVEPFDICQSPSRNNVLLKTSLPSNDAEKNDESAPSREVAGPVLRLGMVLLKSYLAHSEQLEIVKKCRDLGLGPGGFYQPGYKDGAKLHLQMMCLGLSWDPETRKYYKKRPVDGFESPGIPQEFVLLVQKAIQDSHALIKGVAEVSNVEDALPAMSPNICIVNFYTTSGRLGLHQDRDESQESLRKGLPVVSFSIGDSAEFLYGDKRDVDKAERVVLESGDVLIFGGESRHIFHGVPSIIPDSAPKFLLEESNLRPGRLNLTFREY